MGRWDPKEVAEWVRVIRDLAAVCAGLFILAWQTVWAASPNTVLCGIGAFFLGAPAAFRLDEMFKKGGEK